MTTFVLVTLIGVAFLALAQAACIDFTGQNGTLEDACLKDPEGCWWCGEGGAVYDYSCTSRGGSTCAQLKDNPNIVNTCKVFNCIPSDGTGSGGSTPSSEQRVIVIPLFSILMVLMALTCCLTCCCAWIFMRKRRPARHFVPPAAVTTFAQQQPAMEEPVHSQQYVYIPLQSIPQQSFPIFQQYMSPTVGEPQ